MIAQLGGRSDRQPSEGSDAFDAIPRLVEDAQDRNPLLTGRGRAFRSRVLCREGSGTLGARARSRPSASEMRVVCTVKANDTIVRFEISLFPI